MSKLTNQTGPTQAKGQADFWATEFGWWHSKEKHFLKVSTTNEFINSEVLQFAMFKMQVKKLILPLIERNPGENSMILKINENSIILL